MNWDDDALLEPFRRLPSFDATPEQSDAMWKVIRNRLLRKEQRSYLRIVMSGGSIIAATTLLTMGIKDHFVSQTQESHGTISMTTRAVVPSHTTPSPTINPIQINTSDPIQHYIWKHSGQTDEVWQDIQTGEWRTVRTLPDGNVQTGITKNNILYLITSKNGTVIDAREIPQGPNYDGRKTHILDDRKVTDFSTYTFVGETTQNNRHVSIWIKGPNKYYVDTRTNLPLEVESTDPATDKTGISTWTYSTLPDDQSLFSVPSNVTFKLMPSVNATNGP